MVANAPRTANHDRMTWSEAAMDMIYNAFSFFLIAVETFAIVVMFFLLLLLIVARVVDVVPFIPDETSASLQKAAMLRGAAARKGDDISSDDSVEDACNLCGTLMQNFESNMMLAHNPFYGLRTRETALSTLPIPEEANFLACSDDPCRPGCMQLLSDLQRATREEGYQAFFHTMNTMEDMGLDREKHVGFVVPLLSRVTNMMSQLFERRFTMMTEAERLPGPLVRPLTPLRLDPSKLEPRYHSHEFNASGICKFCHAPMSSVECKASTFAQGAQEAFRARSASAPKMPCATCRLGQELDTPQPLMRMTTGGYQQFHTTLWFLANPRHAQHAEICHSVCEGRFSLQERYIFEFKDILSRYPFRRFFYEIHTMPWPVFLLLVACLALLFRAPQHMVQGNLEWRDTLEGLYPSAVDPVEWPTPSLPTHHGVPLGASRFRRR